jgi:hypothetical protein
MKGIRERKIIIIFKKYLLSLSALILYALLFTFCDSPDRGNGAEVQALEPKDEQTKPIKAELVTFFIDNSGGMVGYVNDKSQGQNNFKLSISKLAQKPQFQIDLVNKKFNFVNGPNELVITPIGEEASTFADKLTPANFNVGDVSGNDLNAMLQLALSHAGNDSISIFITDAIYDIQDKADPLMSLRIKSDETVNHFVKRLNDENLQTLVIKLKSHFLGIYYYGIKSGGVSISQNRPYYIFTFGSQEMLNKYLSDDFVSDLYGYEDQVRFVLPNEYQVNYAISTTYNKSGEFLIDKNDPYKLNDISTKQGSYFQFSVGVDYSQLPVSDNYLINTRNYEVSTGFTIDKVEKVNSTMFHSISSSKMNPTHLITIRADGIPRGQLTLKLKKEIPSWIEKSNVNDDSKIKNDSETTFGLNYLIKGIVNAYNSLSDRDYFTSITFTLS